MKIKTIKFANQVKLGTDGVNSVTDNKGQDRKTQIDVELTQGVLIKLTRGSDVTYTSLFNTVYFIADDSTDEKQAAPEGVSKKKSK